MQKFHESGLTSGGGGTETQNQQSSEFGPDGSGKPETGKSDNISPKDTGTAPGPEQAKETVGEKAKTDWAGEMKSGAMTSGEKPQDQDKEQQPLGDYRVGVDFNPSKSPLVDEVKSTTAHLINQLESFANSNKLDGEQMRCVREAQTQFETAAMWAVKAYTKKVR